MAYGTVNADVIGTSVTGSNLGAGNASIMKNRLINGAMVIDQRNAGASVTNTAGSVFAVDRWDAYGSQASKFTIQQNAGSVTPPAGYKNYVGVTSSSAYSVLAADEFALSQKIEGYNVADLDFGTANAKTVTLSFWVRSSLTGSFGGNIANGALTRAYPFSFTISSANTWEQKTITVAGDTTGTWLTTNGIGLFVRFGLGVGTTYGSGTAGAWTGTYADVPTGSVSVVGTSGATFYITGVQLEVGSSATGFEYRQYGQELALCQRYFEIGGIFAFVGNVTTGNNYAARMTFKVTKRATPTLVYGDSANSGFPAGSAVDSTPDVNAYGAYKSCNATTTAGYWWATSTASAEL